jgi:formylglycine-generating enzyme required for sulfatase activity
MKSVAVGSLTNCVTSAVGYSGVYDLSGNVFEWVDRCNSIGTCAYYGGSFTDMITSCGDTLLNTRNFVSGDIGFRCCSQ